MSERLTDMYARVEAERNALLAVVAQLRAERDAAEDRAGGYKIAADRAVLARDALREALRIARRWIEDDTEDSIGVLATIDAALAPAPEAETT